MWCKKHKGVFHYFGADMAEAEKRYLAEWPDIMAGRKPRAEVGTVTVRQLVNVFLTSKRDRVDSGELSAQTWAEYHRACERIIDTFGRDRVVADLRPDDFGKLRAAAAKKLGPVALGKFITLTKMVFGFAFKAELIAAPVRYGDEFGKPAKRIMRLERHRKGPKLIPAADVWRVLAVADVQLRAMVWLGLNAGFGQTDCANLQRSALTSRPGWIDSPRTKTGIGRRAPLWSETLDALAEVERTRPDPNDPECDGGCVFITRHGNRWVRYTDRGAEKRGINLDAVAGEWRKVCKRAGVTAPGGPYTLRKTFRTVADELKDQPAAMLIMGHADQSISDCYREQISDDRLRAVTDHVRTWMLAGRDGDRQA